MIRTARIILAGLLHILAAKVDVHDTVMVDMTYDKLTVEDTLLHSDAIVRAMDAQARLN